MKTTKKMVKELELRTENLEKVQDAQMKGLAVLGAATIIEYVVAPVISAGVNAVIDGVKNRKAAAAAAAAEFHEDEDEEGGENNA